MVVDKKGTSNLLREGILIRASTRLINLRWLLAKHYGGKQIRLAKRLGKRLNVIWRLFTDDPKHRRNIGDDLAREIERATGYPEGWLDVAYFGTPDPAQATEKPCAKGNVVSPWGYRWVPILDYVQAWTWTERADPYPITANTEIAWTAGKNLSDRAFGLVVEGEGMQDIFYPGDIVIIDPAMPPKPGDFVVSKITKEPIVTFAKYRPRGVDKDGQPIIELAPLNDDYPTVIMDAANPGRLIGTMLIHYRFRQRDQVFLGLGRPPLVVEPDQADTDKETSG